MVSTKPFSQEVEIYIHMSPVAGIHTQLGDIEEWFTSTCPHSQVCKLLIVYQIPYKIIRSLKRILSTHAFHWMCGIHTGLEVGHWQLNENQVYSEMYVCLAVLYEWKNFLISHLIYQVICTTVLLLYTPYYGNMQ